MSLIEKPSQDNPPKPPVNNIPGNLIGASHEILAETVLPHAVVYTDETGVEHDAQFSTVSQVDPPKRFNGPNHREAVIERSEVFGKLISAEAKLLDKLQALEEANIEARTDAGTNLPNKRAFEEQYRKTFESIEQSDEVPNILLMNIDLDNFKQVNDTLGHDAGDRVLELVAKILDMTLRVRKEDGEIVARMGGDEFSALINGKNRKNGNRDVNMTTDKIIEGVKERIRSEVKKLAEEIELPDLGISFGVASYQEEGFENETPAEFKERADSLMYKDKEEKNKRRDPERNDRNPPREIV